MSSAPQIKSCLHHTAYVTRDMEAVRHFYEDLVGMHLSATWCEKTDLFGKERVYMHCFFELGTGESLAFFQFADEDDAQEFGPELPPSGFRHVALNVDQKTQDGIKARLAAAGYKEPEMYFLEHGYCRSLYCFDPAGMIVEFCCDHPEVEKINADKKPQAHAELKRWLAGDHSPNNLAFHRHS